MAVSQVRELLLCMHEYALTGSAQALIRTYSRTCRPGTWEVFVQDMTMLGMADHVAYARSLEPSRALPAPPSSPALPGAGRGWFRSRRYARSLEPPPDLPPPDLPLSPSYPPQP